MRRTNISLKRLIAWLRPQPIDILALASLAISCFYITVFNVVFFTPSLKASAFPINHYVLPLLIAVLLYFASTFLNNNKYDIYHVVLPVRAIIMLMAIVYIHFNLKLWAHLVNQNNFDATYAYYDEQFSFIIRVAGFISYILKYYYEWPQMYHDVFVGMFFCSFTLHALFRRDSQLDRMTFAVSLVLILGGILYSIAPAFGPFIYSLSYSNHTSNNQLAMLMFTKQLIASKGASYQDINFAMPLGAMPSLHASHAYVLTFYAAKYLQIIRIIYVLCFIFIITEAISAKWHYFIDIPVGLLLAILCIRISENAFGIHKTAT